MIKKLKSSLKVSELLNAAINIKNLNPGIINSAINSSKNAAPPLMLKKQSQTASAMTLIFSHRSFMEPILQRILQNCKAMLEKVVIG